MKRGVIVLLIFFILAASVSALQVTHDPIQNEALPGGQVSYNIRLINNEDIPLHIEIKTVDLNWLLEQGENSFTIPSGKSKDTVVAFSPLSTDRISPGNYGINIIIDTQTTRLEKILPAKIVAFGEVLDVQFAEDPVIDPRRGTILRLTAKNNNQILLPSMNIELSASHFQFTKTFSLGKEESATLEFPVEINPLTPEGDYQTNVKVELEGHTLVNEYLAYKVQEYQDLKEVVTPQRGFLISGETITQTNEGNSKVSSSVSRQFSWMQYKFSTFSEQPTKTTENSQGFFVEWGFSLSPGEAKTVSYTINYRSIFVFILLIALVIYLWHRFRSRNTLVVDKKVLAMHTEAGSVRVIKVVLNIKNRGGTTINNVRLIDRVPGVIKAPTQYGAVKPGTVKATPQGTTMVWDFAAVRPREERIITYRLEGRIQLLGKVVLPGAAASYSISGRHVSARSSSVSLREKK